jgi:hypothetical protein
MFFKTRKSRGSCQKNIVLELLLAARSLARSIQDASDPLIRHLSGESPDDIRGRLIQGPASFTVTCFAHFELGVIASLPMNHQIDLVAVDASDDLNNDGA